MITEVDLTNWKKKSEIIKELALKEINIDERKIRLFVDKHNQRYFSHLEEDFIAHGPKGYIRTKDAEIIRKSIEDGKKRALNLLWKYSRTKKALGENNNLKFELEERGIIDG